MVTSAENAEIDDVNVIRDGDHLYFYNNELESINLWRDFLCYQIL